MKTGHLTETFIRVQHRLPFSTTCSGRTINHHTMDSATTTTTTSASQKKSNRIQQRFERDFLPRHGKLWRTMIESSGSNRRMAIIPKAATPPPPPPAAAAAAIDFMDAIENQKTMTIKIPSHSTKDNGGDGCACEGCVPPVLELDGSDESDVENRNNLMEHHLPRTRRRDSTKSDDDDDEASLSPSSGEDNFMDDDYSSSIKTPLPTDLVADFGQFLTFGEAADDEPWKVEEGIREKEENNDDDGEQHNEFEEEEEELDSSGSSSVIRFDISHILDASPAKPNADVDVNENVFSEQLNPQFSPQAGGKANSQTIPDHQEEWGETFSAKSSSSVDSSIYQVDLSYLVQSPERNGTPRENILASNRHSPDKVSADGDLSSSHNQESSSKTIAPDVGSSGRDSVNLDEPGVPAVMASAREKSPSSAGATKPPNPQEIIDLVNSDDDDDDDDNNNNNLVDTSDESVAEWKTRASATKPINIDDSSEDNEWDGGSSSDFSFESPDEEYSDSGKDLRRKSISKLARGGTRRSSSFPIDSENWNPNIELPTKPKTKRTMGPAAFKKNREALSSKYFQEYDSAAFEGKLASVKVVWSKKLRTTAGLTRLQRRRQDFTPGVPATRIAIIELSTKVLDDPERLQSTLLHEMVHAAAWIIDGVSNPPHGASFKKWAKIAMRRIPGVEVTTTHDYKIQYKYAWACTTPGCKFLVQRHSRSVDLKRQCCGRCRGRLVEVDVPDHSSRDNVGKTPKKRAPPSGYNLFVKEHSKAVRERLTMRHKGTGKVSQADVMKECARLWQEKKELEHAKE